MSTGNFDLGWLTQWDDPNMGSPRFKRYRGRPGDLVRVEDGALLGSRYSHGRPYFLDTTGLADLADRIVRRLPRRAARWIQRGRDRHGWHAVVLDVDLPAALIPSSTEGHSHLFIDCPMSWRRYRHLLKALAKAGVIEPGYYRASRRFRMSMVRRPGVLKDAASSVPSGGLDEHPFGRVNRSA